MAIFYFRTSIVRAGHGKSAVASAAYQSAEKELKSDRLGQSFSYSNKEEVIHSEILLPQNAPEEYKDRNTLWNAVEASQKNINSRYARQFVIAVPNEWETEEAIKRCRSFLQETFVNKGMIVDWSFHNKKSDDPEKPDNVHIHVMTTVRGINPDGTWQIMEKKEYALDKDGNKIPEIDPKTGEQKVRKRIRNGHVSTEKIWKRVNVIRNAWNSMQQLTEWKKQWAEHCNQYLKPEEQIDYRSYKQRGLDRLPQLHEGPDARAALVRGEVFDVVKENRERRAINMRLDMLEAALGKIKAVFYELKEKIIGGIEYHEQTRSNTQGGYSGRVYAANAGTSAIDAGTAESALGSRPESSDCRKEARGIGSQDSELAAARQRISTIRKRISDFIGRNRTLVERIGDASKREREIENIDNRIGQIKEQRRAINERRKQIRAILLGGVGGRDGGSAGGRTGGADPAQAERTAGSDTDAFIRQVQADIFRARTSVEKSGAERQTREAKRNRTNDGSTKQTQKRHRHRT